MSAAVDGDMACIAAIEPRLAPVAAIGSARDAVAPLVAEGCALGHALTWCIGDHRTHGVGAIQPFHAAGHVLWPAKVGTHVLARVHSAIACMYVVSKYVQRVVVD